MVGNSSHPVIVAVLPCLLFLFGARLNTRENDSSEKVSVKSQKENIRRANRKSIDQRIKIKFHQLLFSGWVIWHREDCNCEISSDLRAHFCFWHVGGVFHPLPESGYSGYACNAVGYNATNERLSCGVWQQLSRYNKHETSGQRFR
jgi:hypothetical protein